MSLGPVHRVVHVEAAAGRLFEHPGDEDVSELWVAYHSAADAYAYLGVPQMHLPRGRGGFERRTRQPHDKAVLSLRAAPLVPGDAPRRVVSDLGEHASEVVLRVETVELGAFDQRRDCGSEAAAGNGTGTGVILSSKQRASAAQRARL